MGVLDIESFFPAKDRFALAMKLNNLLAAPAFAAWLEGEPLDVAAILRTPGGKPRISIFSIAHLSDAERMFFVTMLLNETVGWMRGQSGTTSLRAIVYMDEIAGYFPPVATPPSKAPLLTLLKQGRAFGLGVVLATQNPVDLDYKGLSNAGTWFLGRLQTERDKARGRGGGRRSEVRPGRNGADPRGPEDTRLPDERRPRGRAGRLRVALGDVLPARATDARADQDADGSPESRGPGCARRGRDGFHRFEEHGSAPGKRRAMPPSPGRSSRLQSPSTSCPSAARGTPGWFTGRRRSALRRCGTPM